MSPYAAILSARFRTLLQYRTAAIAGLGTQLFWGLIRVMIFEAFYRSSNAPQPMALRDVVTYLLTVRNAYLTKVKQHVDKLEKACGQLRADYVPVTTKQPFTSALSDFIGRRAFQQR